MSDEELLGVAVALLYYSKHQRSWLTPNQPHQPWKQWGSYYNRLTSDEFRQRFQMSKYAFDGLVWIVWCYWMPPEIKVAITLQYLAGGQILDIADHFGYSVPVAYNVKQQMITAILQKGSQIGEVVFKHDDWEWLANKAMMFGGAHSTNLLAEKCVSALDGLAVEIEKPCAAKSPQQFSNQKGFFTLWAVFFPRSRCWSFFLIVKHSHSAGEKSVLINFNQSEGIITIIERNLLKKITKSCHEKCNYWRSTFVHLIFLEGLYNEHPPIDQTLTAGIRLIQQYTHEQFWNPSRNQQPLNQAQYHQSWRVEKLHSFERNVQ